MTEAIRAGNAVFNRHRAPTSRLTRLLAHIPNIRAAAFWQSSAEIGVEGACIIATSTTAETAMAALSCNGLSGITPTTRGLLLNPNRGVGFVVPTTHAKEFALAHWLVGGADGDRHRCNGSRHHRRHPPPSSATSMRMTLNPPERERKWQNRFVRRTEKRCCRAGTLRVHGLIRPTPDVWATADTVWGEKACSAGEFRQFADQAAGHLGNVGFGGQIPCAPYSS